MHQDNLELIHALLELKKEGGIFKDYLFPISMSLFSALVGGSVALIINAKQEGNRLEREKFHHSNRLIFKVVEGLNDLISIKANYNGIKSGNPHFRCFQFPEILLNSHPINVDLSNYAFIREVKTCNFTVKKKISRFIYNKLLRKSFISPSKEELGRSWRNLSRIGAMLSNYNTILHQIEKRNKLDDVARERILAYYGEKLPRNEEEFSVGFKQCLGKKQILNLIDLTELTISLIDHVILEMDSFVREFPDIAESNIELSKVEMKRKLIRFYNDRPLYLECLKPTSPPNYVELSVAFGESPKIMQQRYTFSDWF